MAYQATSLEEGNPQDVAWALAWVRFYLRDTTDPLVYSDEELLAVIKAEAFVHESVTYYRPHVVASGLLLADPDRATSESLLGSSIETRSPAKIAAGIRSQGRWIDALIQTAAGVRPPTGRTLVPVW